MGIAYASQTGTTISTHAVSEVLGAQTDQTGNNTVIVSDSYTNIENGQSGDGTNGIGLSYVGRLIIIDNASGSPQIRRCTAEVATGTGTTYRLTVHEDWDTNPVATTQIIDIPYELADIEDGTASGGIGYITRTGFFTFTNDLIIASGGGLQMLDGVTTELDDNGNNATFIANSGGYFYSGYEAGGEYINGGIMLGINNVTGEPLIDFQTGCAGYVYDMLFWGQLVDMGFLHGVAGVNYYGTKWLNTTNEIQLYDASVVVGKIYGKGATTAIARVNSKTFIDGAVLANIHALDSEANTTTELLRYMSGITFSGVTNILTVRQNKTWYIVDPVWSVVTYTDLDWNGTSTLCYVHDKRSIKATVQEADGTLLQDALVNVYEHTQLLDLVMKGTTNISGYFAGDFTYKLHETNSLTTTYGGHALQAGKWLYLPFVAAQSSVDAFNGSIVLSADSNIVETTQATALTAGSGITWNEDTNPSELFSFTLGAGTVADGMIVTFAPSGAVGTITKALAGDSVAGTIHLKDRNATAIADGDTFSRTGGTAGTFSGTYTNVSKQPFSIWVDGNAKNYQVIYDYIAALTTETTLSATGEIIWEWCRSAQAQALYATGSSFYTEQSNSKGVIVVNTGAGALAYVTDDTGTQYIPPSTVSFTFTLSPSITGYEWRLYEDSGISGEIGTVLLAGEETAAADNQAYVYSYTTDFDVVLQIIASGYEESLTYLTLTGNNSDITINLEVEDNT